ncbi:ATP-binding protein [Neptunomonas qingdaonensis]|uniref:histidine kinase n=1 Tax=Neptunomonas qingdaonensis TaxID=1045558 RepID=A0A1I2M0F7_9GAMM|nr:ATP-binding protein [Neptunomonas qingdaonensis]SFF84300.1 two-component system, OmpR family, sensor histidine kinase PhoQ [Neptunomonas qingdaonensis]
MKKSYAGLASRSLKARLLIASFILLPMIIGVAGYALQNSFAYSLQASLEKRLRLQVYLMIGAAEMQDGKLAIPETQHQLRQGDETFGFIHTHLGLPQWESTNAHQLSDKVRDSVVATRIRIGETRFNYFEDENLYLYQYPLQWESAGVARRYLFSIVESGAQLSAELNAYRTQLWGWLFAVTVLALMLQTLITRWGLKPLSGLVEDLHNIERGYSTRLAGYYPEEVQGVTDSLNHLLHSERNQRERYRNTLGDLAHSLKTPLAVIRGAGNEQMLYDGYRHVVEDQVRRMDQIVQYQLARAVRSQTNSIAQATPLAPIIKRITSALGKVYREKNVDISLQLDETALFGADERDMMELLGNMLENAFKYSHSAVRVSLTKEADWVQLDIEDDGPGVSREMRHVILQRGARVDTSAAPGQGIGLTVAVDILSSYDGQLEVSESSLGGARFKIILPIG